MVWSDICSLRPHLHRNFFLLCLVTLIPMLTAPFGRTYFFHRLGALPGCVSYGLLLIRLFKTMFFCVTALAILELSLKTRLVLNPQRTEFWD